MLISISYKKPIWLVSGFLIGGFIAACASPPPKSPEFQRRTKAAQEAKEIQDRNNQIRENNRQIQEQNRLEELELARMRAERAAQRNAERAARQQDIGQDQ